MADHGLRFLHLMESNRLVSLCWRLPRSLVSSLCRLILKSAARPAHWPEEVVCCGYHTSTLGYETTECLLLQSQISSSRKAAYPSFRREHEQVHKYITRSTKSANISVSVSMIRNMNSKRLKSVRRGVEMDPRSRKRAPGVHFARYESIGSEK